MGILLNALSIIMGSITGDVFKKYIKFKNFTVLSISIMIISLVGFLENIFGIEDKLLKSDELLLIVFALIIGTLLGDAIDLETKLMSLSNKTGKDFSALVDATIFFGVGGLQICGPILLATTGDNSQLFLKSIIDFPFALMFGISYGKKTAFSALPVAMVQIVITALAILSKQFIDAAFIRQLCSMGYIILFFSGFNLICSKGHKINNINMLIGIAVIFAYNIALKLWR